MDPTKEQIILITQCYGLWGRDNVYVYGPYPYDHNVRVKCRSRVGIHRMMYSPEGDILASSMDTTMLDVDEYTIKPRNAIDN